MRPLGDFVLVKEAEERTQSVGGVLITSSEQMIFRGEVVSTGDKVTGIEESDVVIVSKKDPRIMLVEVTEEGQTFYLVKQQDCIAVQ